VSSNETTVQLSERELEILKMVATGASNQQIAHRLVISVNTVKVHLHNIFEKLEVQSRTEATRYAIQKGWVAVSGDGVEAAEAPALPRRTFLLDAHARPPLAWWQQIYLVFATVLALGVVFVPSIPRQAPIEKPILPVIYAQLPTPVPPTPANASVNHWVTQAAMPTKRAGLGLVAFEGKIFAIGGVRDNNRATRSVEIYDSITNSWSEGSAKPTATANIAGVVLEGKIYVPGGCTNEGQAVNTLEIYDPKEDNWEKGATLPEVRCGYGLVAWQDHLYLFGGWDGKMFVDTIFVYSIKDRKWQVLDSLMPKPMGYVGAAVLNDTIYLVGGYDGQEEFDQTYVFEPATGNWQIKAPLHHERGGLGLIATANNLYAIGGGWNQTLTTSEKYDPTSDTWTTFETPFTDQWRNMGLTAIDTKIYAVGGWNGTERKFMDSVVSYQFLFQLFLPISAD
jgi:DNA-binding CsgD family transcriptional regulator/N-acetylneuraminic acid mutarotase